MDPFIIPIKIDSPAERIRYEQKILLTGSCFTEHIGTHLAEMKFDTMQNPNGILFDPLSVAQSLISYLAPELYGPQDLFLHDELWQSWKHHGQFADTLRENTLNKINSSQQAAHVFLKQTDWLIITLGSAFAYILKDQNRPVANCHRAPGKVFAKHLMTIEEIQTALDGCLYQLFYFNPRLKVIFTVSPVRHIRDGVV